MVWVFSNRPDLGKLEKAAPSYTLLHSAPAGETTATKVDDVRRIFLVPDGASHV